MKLFILRRIPSPSFRLTRGMSTAPPVCGEDEYAGRVIRGMLFVCLFSFVFFVCVGGIGSKPCPHHFFNNKGTVVVPRLQRSTRCRAAARRVLCMSYEVLHILPTPVSHLAKRGFVWRVWILCMTFIVGHMTLRVTPAPPGIITSDLFSSKEERLCLKTIVSRRGAADEGRSGGGGGVKARAQRHAVWVVFLASGAQ